MDNAGTGFLLLVVAGVLNASFALPMKFTRVGHGRTHGQFGARWHCC